MSARVFPAIRDIPQTGVPTWQYEILAQMKEAIEVLSGQTASGNYKAILNTDITVAQADNVYIKRVSAQGAGYNISGSLVADLADYRLLVQNVQDLITSMIYLQQQVNSLIEQLEAK